MENKQLSAVFAAILLSVIPIYAHEQLFVRCCEGHNGQAHRLAKGE